MASPFDLFAPDIFGTMGLPSPVMPGTYSWFRGLYPPNAPGTNGMAPVPPMPEIGAPGKAPAVYPPMPPMPDKAPGPIPAYPQAPKAADEWNQPPGVAQYYDRLTAPGAKPSSPPMMGRSPAPAASPPEPGIYQENVPPELMPGTQYGMRVDDSTFKQPSPTEAPRQPNWYERNKDWITMASRDLGALGRGMLQAPPGYNAFGMGFSNVIDDREKRLDSDLKRQLLKAQVGKADAEAQTREWAKQLYADTRIPMPVRMAALFKPESIPELMKELDEPTQALLAKYAAAKAGLVAGATERAKLAPDIVSAEANKAGLIEGAKTAATGGNTTIAKLFRDRDNALAAGDAAKARAIQAEIDKEAAQSEKAKMDATTAGANIKAAQVARQDFETAVAYFVDPKTGKVNPEIRTQGMVPWSNARNQFAGLKQAAINFASAKGGKALTEPEIAMYIEPNLPSALDNDAGIRMKLARLRRYLDSVGGTSSAPTTPGTGAQRYRMGTDGAIR